MKSNKQRPIYEPWYIEHSNPNLTAVNYCCKELHVSCRRVPGSASEKELKSLLKNELLHLVLARVLKSYKRLLTYLMHTRCFCEFSHKLAKSLKIIYRKTIFSKVAGCCVQIYQKINLFQAASLGKYDSGRFNSEVYLEICQQNTPS